MQIIYNKKNIILDENQIRLFKKLETLGEKLLVPKRSKSFLSKFFKARNDNEPESFYIYGSVGRGKTMVVRNFFNNLAIKNKSYFHFNDFMQRVHRELYVLRNEPNNNDLTQRATENIIGDSALICLDEFQVEDVADAMILSRIFSYIFQKNIKVIFTSNSYPENLYPNGLQRDLFLKFVREILYKYCEIVNLDSKIDYRTLYLKSVKEHYFYPVNSENQKKIQEIFSKVTDGNQTEETEIELLGRKLLIKKSYKNIAVFDFKELCEDNLGAADYQAICQRFNIIFLLNVPKLSAEYRNEAKRLILFIDEVYENKVALIVLGEVAPEEIYVNGMGASAFKRAVSRINEITN